MATSILGYKQAPGAKYWKQIPELSLDQVNKTTKPKQNGEADGARNYPEAKAHVFAETENAIVYQVEKYLKTVDDFSNKELTDIKREVDSLALENVPGEFQEIQSSAEKAFNRYSLKAMPELKKLRIAEQEQLRDLNFFKSRNNLVRLAKYPASMLYAFGIIFLILVFECCLNLFFFAEGSPIGAVGGAINAALVSFVNIIVSFFVGRFFLPNTNHSKTWRALLLGYFPMIVWAIIMLTFHLGVAHYRDLLILDPENAVRGALDKLRIAPFHIETMESAGVLLMGIIVAIIALIDGYRSDDVYPGYGEKDRDYREALNNYDRSESAFRETLVATISDAESAVDARIGAYENRQKNLDDLYTGSASVIEHFENIYQQMNEILRTAVSTYREANQRVRTAPLPASFGQMPVVQRLLRQDFHCKRLEELQIIKDKSAKQLMDFKATAAAARRELSQSTAEMGKQIEQLSSNNREQALTEIKNREEAV